MRKVWLLLFPKFSLVDVSGMLAVFEAANALLQDENSAAAYVVRLASVAGGPVASSSGVVLSTAALPHRLRGRANTLFIAGEWSDHSAMDQPPSARRLHRWVLDNRKHLVRCAMLGANTSPLVTNTLIARWQHSVPGDAPPDHAAVQSPFVASETARDWQVVERGQGIDLALSWTEEDQGAEFAHALSSRLPHPRSKRYGAKPYRSILIEQPARDARVVELHLWIATHLREKLRVARLAQQVHMSVRSFARFYGRATGFTPGQGVQQIRIDTACRLIETSARPLKAIAAQCGYGSQEVMRRAFLRVVGITPLEYRRRLR